MGTHQYRNSGPTLVVKARGGFSFERNWGKPGEKRPKRKKLAETADTVLNTVNMRNNDT